MNSVNESLFKDSAYLNPLHILSIAANVVQDLSNIEVRAEDLRTIYVQATGFQLVDFILEAANFSVGEPIQTVYKQIADELVQPLRCPFPGMHHAICKLDQLDCPRLISLLFHYCPFENEYEDFIQAIGERFLALENDPFISTRGPAELIELVKIFENVSHTAIKNLLYRFLLEFLRPQRDGECKFAKLSLDDAISAVNCLVTKKDKDEELITLFSTKFVNKNKDGELDFSLYTSDQLLRLACGVSKYGDSRAFQKLGDVLLQECLRPERMTILQEKERGIQMLSCFTEKGPQAAPLFHQFSEYFFKKKSNDTIDLTQFSSSQIIELLGLFSSQGSEASQLLLTCQNVLLQRKKEAAIEEQVGADSLCVNLVIFCKSLYAIADRGCLQDSFMEVVEWVFKLQHDQIGEIPSLYLAELILACMTCAHDFDEHLWDDIFGYLLHLEQDSPDTAVSLPLFLKILSKSSANGYNGLIEEVRLFSTFFETFVTFYQKEKLAGRLTITPDEYAFLFRTGLGYFEIHRPDLLQVLFQELQQVSFDFAYAFKQYKTHELLQSILLLNGARFASLHPIMQQEFLSRKEEIRSICLKKVSSLILAFGRHPQINKEVFTFFEEMFLERASDWMKEVTPSGLSEIVCTFLDARCGSKWLYEVFQSRLIAINAQGNSPLHTISFTMICRLAIAFMKCGRGTFEFYKALESQFIARHTRLTEEDFVYFIEFLTALNLLSQKDAKYGAALKAVLIKDACKWLSSLSPQSLVQLLCLKDFPGDFSTLIPAFFLRPSIEDVNRRQLQALSFKELVFVATWLLQHQPQGYGLLVQLMKLELLLKREKMSELDSLEVFNFYIFFKKIALMGHGDVCHLLEIEFLRKEPDHPQKIQLCTESQLIELLRVNETGNSSQQFVKTCEEELFSRGLKAFKELIWKCMSLKALQFLERIQDVKQVDEKGNTLLHYAASCGAVDIVQALLNRGGLEINRVNFVGVSPLQYACYGLHKEVVQLLLQYDASCGISSRKSTLPPAFQLALLNPNKELARELFLSFFSGFNAIRLRLYAQGVEDFIPYCIQNANQIVDPSNHIGNTNPLEIAYLVQDFPLAVAIVKAMTPSQATSFLAHLLIKYKTPIIVYAAMYMVACIRKDENKAISLLKEKQLLSFSFPDGESALHIAVKYNLFIVIQHLVDRKIDINKSNKQGKTPLHFATYNNSRKSVQILLSAHADPIRLDNAKNTPWHVFRETLLVDRERFLEVPYLLQDLQLLQARMIISTQTEITLALATIRKKFPKAATEFFEYAQYRINSDHMKRAVRSDIPVKPVNVHLNELLGFFDAIKFTDIQKDSSYDQVAFQLDTGTTDTKELREILEQDFIVKIQKKIPYLGTPPAKTQHLHVFYDTIERAISHTICKLREINDRALQEKVIIEYLRAAKFCGGRIFNAALDCYDSIVRGIEVSFEKTIYELAGDLRKILLDSLVPSGPQSVHVANGYFYLLAAELNLPNKESAFQDPLAPVIDKNSVRAAFFRLYTALSIVSVYFFVQFH
ncbi:MAG: ankyrin repeat protein, partial [Chlamydiia bacterium]|nr:ankyrin repeat protein [Chlamydiia bacterium]